MRERTVKKIKEMSSLEKIEAAATSILLVPLFFLANVFVGPNTAFVFAIFFGVSVVVAFEYASRLGAAGISIALSVTTLIHICLLYWIYRSGFSFMEGPALFSALPITIADYIGSSVVFYQVARHR